MRPSGVLTRFIAKTDYQVLDKHTTEKEVLVPYLSLVTQMCVAVALLEIAEAALRATSQSDVTSAPLKLLADYAEE